MFVQRGVWWGTVCVSSVAHHYCTIRATTKHFEHWMYVIMYPWARILYCKKSPFNLWVIRRSWGVLSVFGFLNSADTTANENPLLHVPVLSGFFVYCQRMILCLLVKAPTHFTRPTARGPSPRHPPTTLRFPAWSSSPCSETHRAGSAPRTVSSWGVSSDARGRGVCR